MQPRCGQGRRDEMHGDHTRTTATPQSCARDRGGRAPLRTVGRRPGDGSSKGTSKALTTSSGDLIRRVILGPAAVNGAVDAYNAAIACTASASGPSSST